MGLAASQARFLGLTARKSNVEYQGQQINQQRVALSNEVMGLYGEYNRLEVPVPPSVNDYQKTTYTLDSTYEGYEIQSFSKITTGDNAGYYDVVLTYDDQLATAYTYTAKQAEISATPNGKNYDEILFKFGTEEYFFDRKDIENSTITEITGEYEKYQGLTTIIKDQKIDISDPQNLPVFYMFMKNGVAYYTSKNDLDTTFANNGENSYYGDYAFAYQGALTQQKTVNAVAALTQESSGRLSTIHIKESSEAPDLVGQTYSITTGQEEDTTTYTDAMNNYYYEKALYEREVERINKKTEELQEQDRTLELQLNQLDTEQLALKTEMESISKVIEETIDSVFKTFSG